MITIKICTKCNRPQEQTEYWNSKLTIDGLSSWCKTCTRQDGRNRYKQNPSKKLKENKSWKVKNRVKYLENERWSAIKRKFGLSKEDYFKLLEQQEFRCAICKRREPGNARHKYLSVDHDHRTNAIRGLLCDPCNNVLGKAEDNIDILKSAISYLEKFK